MEGPDLDLDFQRLMQIIRGRRSVRRFSSRPVPGELLGQVLEAARWAPSAGNRQAFRLLVVSSRPEIEAMGRAVHAASERILAAGRGDQAQRLAAYLDNFRRFTGAPLVIVPLYRVGVDLLGPEAAGDGAVARNLVDSLSSVSAAVMNLLLAAHTAGLGACWMTGPLVAAAQLRRILQVPRGWEVAAVVPLGFADETPDAPPRRELEQLLRRIAPPGTKEQP